MKLSGFKNVVSVLKWGSLNHSPYIFLDMELCDLNLEDYIQRKWPPGIEELIPSFAIVDTLAPPLRIIPIWEIMRDICSGVAYIHDRGEIHRDLKPRNGNSRGERC